MIDGMVMKGRRVIMLVQLQSKAMKQLQDNHMGIKA